MSTITIYALAPLNLPTEQEYIRAFDRFIDILLRFEDYDGFLSQRIRTWGAAVIDCNEPSQLIVKIRELQLDILVNPFNNAPLESPMIDNGWVWERWMLEDYKNCCRIASQPLISPFTKQPIQEKEHLFAKETIVWLQESLSMRGEKEEVKTNNLELTRELVLAGHSISPPIAMMKLYMYNTLAQKAISLLKQKMATEQLLLFKERIMIVKQEVTAEIAISEEKAVQKTEQHERFLHGEIDTIKEKSKEAVLAYRAEVAEKLEDQEKEIVIANEQIKVQAEGAVQYLSAIRQLTDIARAFRQQNE